MATGDKKRAVMTTDIGDPLSAFPVAPLNPYGVCSTAAATAAKTVTVGYSGTLTLYEGLTVRVKFANGNAAASPTLNVNGTGAKSIAWRGSVSPQEIPSGQILTLTYDGTSWLFSNADTLSVARAVEENANLNTLIDVGAYYCASTAIAGTLSNCPASTAFSMLVTNLGGVNRLQEITSAVGTWRRIKYSSTAWTAWTGGTTDSTPTNNSTNYVSSGGVYSAINDVQKSANYSVQRFRITANGSRQITFTNYAAAFVAVKGYTNNDAWVSLLLRSTSSLLQDDVMASTSISCTMTSDGTVTITSASANPMYGVCIPLTAGVNLVPT